MPLRRWLRGNFKDIRMAVEEYLRSRGIKYSLKIEERLYVYKVGFLSKIILAPYSDGTVYIILPKNHGALLDRLASYLYVPQTRSRGPLDTLLRLIVEKQILQLKVRRSRTGLILSAGLIVLGALLFSAGPGSAGELGAFLAILGLVAIFAPFSSPLLAEPPVIPILYSKYRRELGRISRKIEELSVLLPAKDKEKLELLKSLQQSRD